MGLKPDHWIKQTALEHQMIEPFAEAQVRESVISYGVSSYGYDMRVADEFRVFTNVFSSIVDPKAFDSQSFVEFVRDIHYGWVDGLAINGSGFESHSMVRTLEIELHQVLDDVFAQIGRGVGNTNNNDSLRVEESVHA